MQLKHVLIFTLVVLTVVAALVVPTRHAQASAAKQQATHDMSAMFVNSPVIDGSIHPELVKDNVAYRLFLLSVSTDANPTPSESKRQRAMLSPVQFNEEELAIASAILTDYKRQYDAAIQTYNDAVTSAGSPEQLPDGKELTAELDALTLATKTKLESSVSGDSSHRLDVYVQGEKSKMRTTAE